MVVPGRERTMLDPGNRCVLLWELVVMQRSKSKNERRGAKVDKQVFDWLSMSRAFFVSL
jgi:hypothetical protein